jgi:hypothetical protein
VTPTSKFLKPQDRKYVTPKSKFLKPQFNNKHVISPQQNSLNYTTTTKTFRKKKKKKFHKPKIRQFQKITFPEWKILDLEEVEIRDSRDFGFRDIRKAYAIMKFLNQISFFSWSCFHCTT